MSDQVLQDSKLLVVTHGLESFFILLTTVFDLPYPVHVFHRYELLLEIVSQELAVGAIPKDSFLLQLFHQQLLHLR